MRSRPPPTPSPTIPETQSGISSLSALEKAREEGMHPLSRERPRGSRLISASQEGAGKQGGVRAGMHHGGDYSRGVENEVGSGTEGQGRDFGMRWRSDEGEKQGGVMGRKGRATRIWIIPPATQDTKSQLSVAWMDAYT
ncbi:hypothetical protein BDZ91DRAFT_765198 [Kalaharituber pfeilii]|nr:hypothetical protein BDZ91DRAFT_765198 [Kalaharituber pfeilii]